MSDLEFKKHYLQEIIFKVDFRNIGELLGMESNPDKFVNIIKKEFPKVKVLLSKIKLKFQQKTQK